jgi:hypothetical protein
MINASLLTPLQENQYIPMAILVITHGFTMSTGDLPTEYTAQIRGILPRW